MTRKVLIGRKTKQPANQSVNNGYSTSADTYIVIHRQTGFVLSELFSVAGHAGRSKPGSKPVQLYVRLSFKPVGHQADYVG